MPTNEKNQVRMVGLLPSLGADPIPVRLSTEAAGAGMIEKNEVRMVGVLPAQGADPIPVSGMLYPSPLSISPPAFNPFNETDDFVRRREFLRHSTNLAVQYFAAAVLLPNGVTVTKFTLYGYRDDVAAVLRLDMSRVDRVGASASMGAVVADWTTGYSSKYDDTISLAVIDNVNYSYTLLLRLDPNNNVLDVQFTGAKIDFTA